MAASATLGDAVQVFLTGADIIGPPYQIAPDDSLGNFRSGSRADSFTISRLNAITGLDVKFASGANSPGIGVLTVTATDTIKWQAPGDTEGVAVTITNGQTLLIPSGTGEAYLIVERTSADVLVGTETVELRETFNNIVGGTNFTGDMAAAGEELYRAGMFLFNDTITSCVVWLDAANEAEIRIAKDTPVAGAITDKRVAGETSQPGGLVWVSPTSFGTGLDLGSFVADDLMGLWIEQSVDVDETATPNRLGIIYFRFTLGAITYTQALRGITRVANNGLAAWETWIGVDALPDLSAAPDVISDALNEAGDPPADYDTDALAANHVYYFQSRERNRWGLLGDFLTTKIIRIDAGGDQDFDPPLGPQITQVVPVASGELQIQAAYFPGMESVAADRATAWLIYITDTGVDPDPDLDTPTVVQMGNVKTQAILQHTSSGGYLEGADLRVLLRTRRVEDGPVNVDSENTTIHSVTAQWYGAVEPQAVQMYGTIWGITSPPEPVKTVVVDETYNIHFKTYVGRTEFWHDTILVWCLWKDGFRDAFVTTFGRKSEDVTGSGSDDAIEATSATVFYVNVNGERRMRIDVSSKEIFHAARNAVVDPINTVSDEPVWRKVDATCFQVWSPVDGIWITGGALDDDGIFTIEGGWRVVATQAECLPQ